ncbi:unnamed protein product [Rotaria sordida]|uniref:SRCR domain-containing protein n=1 Tax=Rotaria sordida TaxID=392033 RepID=A0A815F722_9BILA|nr:unnamed protein product [Rotaria sordida]CAF1106548.1 unnamed protein product [Rotaria sordida]CAF1315414.1 unnamed protein product [Rotaria sordida]CAF4235071.1 unnamed protein product [Rotaria sordida]
MATPYSTVKAESDPVCDPYTMKTDSYPSILIKLDVVLTDPLTLRATIRLLNSSRVITFEGVMFPSGFSDDHALVACRSMGCSKVSANALVSWTQTQTCRFTCPDGTSGLQLCRYMQSYLRCPSNPNDAMSLKECVAKPFWADYSDSSSRYGAIGLVCTECGDL